MLGRVGFSNEETAGNNLVRSHHSSLVPPKKKIVESDDDDDDDDDDDEQDRKDRDAVDKDNGKGRIQGEMDDEEEDSFKKSALVRSGARQAGLSSDEEGKR